MRRFLKPLLKTDASSSMALVATPFRIRIVALISFLMLVAGSGLLFSPWQQTSHSTGRVIAYSPNERPQVIAAPVDGRVSHWHVQEGSQVKEGQALAELSDIDPQIMNRLQSELEAAQQKVAAAQQGIDTSRKNVGRQRELAKKGLSSQRAFELAELEYAKLLSELSSATSELARAQVKVSRQSAQIVTAPRVGTIQRIFSAQGSVIVKAGDPIAVLVPSTEDTAVELFVDGNDLPLVSVGRKVRLQFEGWPALQFVGWPSVAVGTFGGKVALVDFTDNGSGKFRSIVLPDKDDAPWPPGTFIRQGLRVQGWILLDQVSLGYELWRRFNGFPQSLNIPDFNAYQTPDKKNNSGKKPEEEDSKSEK